MKESLPEKIGGTIVIALCFTILLGQCNAHDYLAEQRCEKICDDLGFTFEKIALRGGTGQGSKAMSGCLCKTEKGAALAESCKSTPKNKQNRQICGMEDFVFDGWFWLGRIVGATLLAVGVLFGYVSFLAARKKKRKKREKEKEEKEKKEEKEST